MEEEEGVGDSNRRRKQKKKKEVRKDFGEIKKEELIKD